MTAPGGLAPAVASFCAGDLTAEAFQREFERAELAVQRVRGASGSPAVAGVGPPGDGHVAVFTSLSALATYAGKCDWATASGADLFELVP
ncbi:MAG: hypothetical protein ACRDUA_20730, partial [Micromonosporaceae bacterium]